jgi:hypothetical protein
VENSRPKFPNEPEYWSRLGGLWTPFGQLTFSNPMADIYKYDASIENFRRNLLGAVNPLVRVPSEIAMNRSAWLGGDIEKFEGQNTPSIFARLAEAVGVPVPLSRANAAGERQPSLPAKLSYLLNQFTGPQGGLYMSAANPDETSSDTLKLSRLLGLRVWPVEQEKWDRTADFIARKRKADATRKRGYEAP